MIYSHMIVVGIVRRNMDAYWIEQINYLSTQYFQLYSAISYAALAITPSHQQNTHDFADECKNMNGIFNNHVCSASHMRSGLHF